jgi:hypothetical protein
MRIRLIGLSVSACIRDIILGLVDEADVAAIVGGTDIDDHGDTDRVASAYAHGRNSPWASNPERAIDIFLRLWRAGRIIQPRRLGSEPIFIGGGRHWAVQISNADMIKRINLMMQMEDGGYGKTNQGS